MAARKAKTDSAMAQAIAEATKAQVLAPEDAHNILILLNRCPTTGVQEATALAVLAQKLNAIRGNFRGQPSGENSNPAG